jgi:DNA-directed RNA polymerase subunit H (RpoH/RPB5)|tara:strand:+ start:447 stop:1088 length:642 start_codon:yes stop_codon:yes gene_type:complete
MSSQSSGTITSVFKSRQNLLKLLVAQGYDVNDYEEFSVNEVHVMYNNLQLDMLMSSETPADNSKKVYVKYHLAKTLRRDNINDYIDDLYNLEQVLTKNDTLIIVIKQEPHEPLLNILKQIWEQEGIFIMIYNLERLQFNILEHTYVPKHTILNDEEVNDMKKRYNIINDKQLPEISRFDPVAQAIGMRPGQMCKIIRPSKTAITTDYYRICSQ